MPRPKIDQGVIEEGIRLIAEKKSIRKAAKAVGIGEATLRRYKKNLHGQIPSATKSGKVRELKFVPTYDFKLIPRYLFEQIKLARQWNLDRLYGYGKEMAQNPCTLLYSMVDKDFRIKGFLWAHINPLKECIAVSVLSVDRKYQDRGEPLRYAGDFLKEIEKKLGLHGIEWVTNKPRAFEKLGAKKTGRVVMVS